MPSDTTPVRTPAYQQCARLLRQLHAMIREGRDESDEGDDLRDRMDPSWYRLDPEEQSLIRALSADLNAIPQPDTRLPAEWNREMIREHVRSILFGDAPTWRRLLDEQAELFSASAAHHLRSLFWREVGDPAAALTFLQEAFRHSSRSDGENPSRWLPPESLKLIDLLLLLDLERHEAAGRVAEELLTGDLSASIRTAVAQLQELSARVLHSGDSAAADRTEIDRIVRSVELPLIQRLPEFVPILAA